MNQCSRILAFYKSGIPIRDGSITSLWSKTRDEPSRIGIPDCIFEEPQNAICPRQHMRRKGTQAEACGYGLRETDSTKCIPLSTKPSSKTNSQPVEGRANEKQVETHASYGCGSLGHKKITFRFDKSKYFNLANTSYLGSTAHQLLVAELGPRNSIPRDGEIQRILSVRGTSSNVPNNVEIGWLSFIKLSFFEIFSLRCRAAV